MIANDRAAPQRQAALAPQPHLEAAMWNLLREIYEGDGAGWRTRTLRQSLGPLEPRTEAWLAGLAAPVRARAQVVASYLLAQMIKQPDRLLGEVDLVPPDQRTELLILGSGPAFEAPGTVGERFTACARQLPERIAVVDGQRQLRYRELEQLARALARRLVAAGVAPGDRVAIALPPSLEVAIAMLGALYAGAVYVPLELRSPAARRARALAHSGARVLIGEAGGDGFDGQVIASGELAALPVVAVAAVALPEVGPRDAAYLLYTSGTTGEPKGVLVEHRSLINYVSWFARRGGSGDGKGGAGAAAEAPARVTALLTSHAFDLGYTALWTSLLGGGTLHFVSEELRRDLPALVVLLAAHQVSLLKVTPSLLGALLAVRDFAAACRPHLRLVVCGGERIRPADVARFYAAFPEAQLMNHYGPTETTIGSVACVVERQHLAAFADRPVIGQPIANTRAYIIDDELRLLPMGATGELLLGGAGVARGYHGDAERTAQRFVADPFAADAAARAYRTGDLARWTSDGALELLGRADRQIKLRGYRVEPAEIEEAFRRVLGAREAVVVERDAGTPRHRLVAYYVADAPLLAAAWRPALAAALPDYLVPSACVRVDELPRTANGKLDEARLPPPHGEEGGAVGAGGEAEAGAAADAVPGAVAGAVTDAVTDAVADAVPDEVTASGALEHELAALWAEIFGDAAAGRDVTRNFFELGGHSLLMLQLLAEIDERYRVQLPASLFFAEGTIRSLARSLAQSLAARLTAQSVAQAVEQPFAQLAPPPAEQLAPPPADAAAPAAPTPAPSLPSSVEP